MEHYSPLQHIFLSDTWLRFSLNKDDGYLKMLLTGIRKESSHCSKSFFYFLFSLLVFVLFRFVLILTSRHRSLLKGVLERAVKETGR